MSVAEMSAEPSKELSPESLRRVCDPAGFSFQSTEELEMLKEVIGQERAVRALGFGIDIDSPGYHLFAVGVTGTGKTTTIRKLLERKAADEPVPDDWCYVNNFDDSDKPRALRLPAGKGCEFRDDLEKFVEELKVEVPRAFEGEDYQKEAQNVQQEYQKRQQALFEDLKNEAESRGFRLMQAPQGLLLAPVLDGKPVTPDEFDKFDDETRRRVERGQQELQEKLQETMRRAQQLQKEANERLRDLDKQIVAFVMKNNVDELREKYQAFDAVLEHLEKVQADIGNRVQELKQLGRAKEGQQQSPFAQLAGMQGPGFDNYRVNLVVDNCETNGAPVILERNPTAQNLVGRIEHEARFGALVTNFTMLKGGALHRANGGYLIVEAMDVLTKPFSWVTLKRALKNKEAKIETVAEQYFAISTRGVEPEPIPLDVKVVLIGDPYVYYLLYYRDDEFQELFKVKADFDSRTDWTSEMVEGYARFIGTLCREEGLKHFDPTGVAKVIEEAARMVSDQKKLATRFAHLVDLVRESSYWAGKNGNGLVRAGDVEQAIREGLYRLNQAEERMQELVEEGSILIDTEGEALGQVNGVSVMLLGSFAFGKPSRITARTYVGGAGLVNIDRESKLGGRIHNKGVMILSGYLGGKFALEIPLALSASITFEQLYEEVEGDSASSAELYALLSSLSGLPIRQDLAVTGSVNQHGQIQPIGGVNQKTEGFFDVCKRKGLTGTQGIIIPEQNRDNLMLREDVVEAVREGKFHLYPVKTVDEGIALLTGRQAGELQQDGTYPEGTVNRAVHDRLRELAQKGKSFFRPEKEVPSGSRKGEED